MNNKDNFLGKGWAFPVQFGDPINGVKMLSDAEEIKQSLFILLSTQVGERVTRPSFGNHLMEIVSHPKLSALENRIKDLIYLAITRHEPRIDIQRIELNYPEGRESMIHIHLMYQIRQTNVRSNIVYPFYFAEGTHITEV